MSDTLSRDDIHGWVCDDCARTHCYESEGCRCHGPGCYGTIKNVTDVIGD